MHQVFFTVSHVSNLTAITAVAIFAGSILPKRLAFTIPLLARLIFDLFTGFFALPLMAAVYACHISGVLLGLWIKSSSGRLSYWPKIGVSGILSAVIFFLVTNFAFLYGNYPHNFAGIIQSYALALPFFRGTLIGDVGFTVALFGIYQMAKHFSALTPAGQAQ